MEQKDKEIERLQKFESKTPEIAELFNKLKAELEIYRDQTEKFKTCLDKYEQKVMTDGEQNKSQLEVENEQLRGLLRIPEQLFKIKTGLIDNVMKRLDERLTVV